MINNGWKCKCDPDIYEKGSYSRTIGLFNPFKYARKKSQYQSLENKSFEDVAVIMRESLVDVDICLIDEVIDLWNIGIETDEGCCGHNNQEGYISVCNEYIDIMLKLGYIKEQTMLSPSGFLLKHHNPKIIENIKKYKSIEDFNNLKDGHKPQLKEIEE